MTEAPSPAARDRPPPRLDPLVWCAALGFVAVLLAFASQYGYHRDELYFIDCGRHLAWGYVDQPWFTPAVARLAGVLFGQSLVGLRLFPALAGGATVVLAGTLARELGGGRVAQRLSAVGTALSPGLIGASHLHGPTAYDLLAWAALSLVVVRLLRTGDPRLWLVSGAVVGLGFANKHSIAFLALALVAGLLLCGEGAALRTPWLAAGLALALLIALPEILWQAHHGWPTIGMTRRLNEKNGGLARAPLFPVGQLVMAAPAMVPVWLAGLRWFWREPGGRAWRPLAWAYALLVVFFTLTAGSKPYYTAGLYAALVAGGAVVVEGRIVAAGGSLRRRLMLVAATGVAVIPAVLPILPVRDIGWLYPINPLQAETVGWPGFTRTVARVWNALPSAEREHAVVFTGSYGEAGAIDRFGRPLGLPRAVSGHNNVWYWGPGSRDATTVLAVMPNRDLAPDAQGRLGRLFRQVALVATLHNGAGIYNEEWGGRVFVCRGPVARWFDLWPEVQHYD